MDRILSANALLGRWEEASKNQYAAAVRFADCDLDNDEFRGKYWREYMICVNQTNHLWTEYNQAWQAQNNARLNEQVASGE
jgi:hypothetical protein